MKEESEREIFKSYFPVPKGYLILLLVTLFGMGWSHFIDNEIGVLTGLAGIFLFAVAQLIPIRARWAWIISELFYLAFSGATISIFIGSLILLLIRKS